MRHDLSVQGHAFALRPVDIADARFILELRRDPELSRYLHPVSPLLSDQERWLNEYFERDGDYYFIVMRRSTGAPEGAIGLYGLDLESQEAEWGRWVLRPGSPAAVESAWLIYRIAFEVLHLHLVFCRTLAENVKVVSFHRSCGLELRSTEERLNIGCVERPVVRQELTSGMWDRIGPELDRRAAAYSRIIDRRSQ